MSTYPKYDPNNKVVVNFVSRRHPPKKFPIALTLILFAMGLGVVGGYLFTHTIRTPKTSAIAESNTYLR